jgi:hypothetical protein
MKLKILSSITLALTTVINSYADSDKICDNLAKLTCAPGEYNDGTGTARNSTIEDHELKKIQGRVIAKAKEKFKNILVDPKNSFFRSAVLSATGLSINPACDGANKQVSPTGPCLELLLTGLGDITAKKMMAIRQNPALYKPDKTGNFEDEVFVLDSRIFKTVEDQILAEMKAELKIDALDKRVEEVVFPKVKELMLAKIPQMVQDPVMREKLINKITEIEFDGSNCPFRSRDTKEKLSDFLIPNAYYMPNQRDFKYCSGLALQNKSEFQLAYIIAHELSHSIDPCGISIGPHDFTFSYPPGLTKVEAQQSFAFAGVLGCLRGAKSLDAIDIAAFEARRRAEFQKAMGANQQISSPPTMLPIDSTNRNYFCDGDDQITEAFPDWMAAEIIPDYLSTTHGNLNKEQFRTGYSNVWRGLCGDYPSDQFDEHPHMERRINNIILVQPKIRKQMGCPDDLPNDRIYCKHNVNYDSQGKAAESATTKPPQEPSNSQR